MKVKWYVRFRRFIVNNWKALIGGAGALFIAVVSILGKMRVDKGKETADNKNAEKEIERLDDKKEIERLKEKINLEKNKTIRDGRIREIDDIEKITDKKERLKRLAELANKVNT